MKVLVEFDYVEWTKREWIHVYSSPSVHLFLIENTLCLAPRTVAPFSKDGIMHPALTFLPLVDTVGLWKQKIQKPVEFLGDLRLDFQDYVKLRSVRRWSDLAPTSGVNQSHRTREAVQAWCEVQDCQQVLTQRPLVLVGLRLQVYRAEGTTQVRSPTHLCDVN